MSMFVKSTDMSDRERDILDAAFQLFLRYGVKRTRMADISAEAGVSRQTLYNAFSNKDDILRAMIRLFTDRAIEDISQGVQASSSLAEKLDVVLEQIAVRPFETLGVSPNAEDIVLGMNAASRDEIDASNQRLRLEIERVLADHAATASGATPKQLAEFVHVSASAAKSQAESRAHLDSLLQTLKAAVLGFYATGRA